MFVTVFFTLFRNLAVPIVAFFSVKNIIGDKNAFIAVLIVLSVLTFISVLWQFLRVIPDILLVNTNGIFKIAVKIILEICILAGFWYYYIIIFANS